MYGIRFINEGDGPHVQFGLRAEQPVQNIAAAFDLIAADLRAYLGNPPLGIVDPTWASNTLNESVLFDVQLSVYRGEWLLVIKDCYSGTETSTGASNLADVFKFIEHWHWRAFTPMPVTV